MELFLADQNLRNKLLIFYSPIAMKRKLTENFINVLSASMKKTFQLILQVLNNAFLNF